MHKCSRFTFEEKLNAVLTNLSGMMGIKSLSKKLKCNPSNIQLWIAQYKTFGENRLKNNLTNLKYSQKVKLKAVNEYISGKISLSDICIKYKIRSTTQLRKWISLYNNNEVLKSRGGMSVRTKGIRKNLSFKDLIEIVKYYLEISNDFAETAVKFQVSYQQVYQWVHKYNKFGVDGLIDRRGKRKPKDELTEVERLQLENKLLKAKNRRIELENAFLKKLNELEGV